MQGCRLLYLTPQLESGGLERQLTYLLSAMDRELYRPCVAVWNYDEAQPYVAALRELSVPLVPMPPGSPAWVKVRSLRALTRRLRPEIAHSYSYYTNAAVAYACWRTSTIALGSIRCDYEYERASGHVVGRLSGRWPRRQICNSWTALENVSRRRRDPFTPRTLEVVQNAVDLERFHPCSPPVNGPTTIVGVGALSQRKNWGVLLPALAEWRRDGLDFAFRIAGEGPLRGALEAQVRKLELDERVELVGHVDDIASFLADAHVVVHVSAAEGTPNVVLEAMAAGRPVVALASGDTARLVEDGVTGFVAPQDRIDVLEDRLRTLATDRALAATMGRAARARVERTFGVSALADKTLLAYEHAGWRERSA